MLPLFEDTGAADDFNTCAAGPELNGFIAAGDTLAVAPELKKLAGAELKVCGDVTGE